MVAVSAMVLRAAVGRSARARRRDRESEVGSPAARFWGLRKLRGSR